MKEGSDRFDTESEIRLVNVAWVCGRSPDDEDGRLANEQGRVLTDIPNDRLGFGGRHF